MRATLLRCDPMNKQQPPKTIVITFKMRKASCAAPNTTSCVLMLES